MSLQPIAPQEGQRVALKGEDGEYVAATGPLGIPGERFVFVIEGRIGFWPVDLIDEVLGWAT